MTTWILQPRDTLLVRDARPSYAGTGGLRTLDFPWPSSLAGLLRTQIGSAKSGHFDLDIEQAKQIAIRGPLLVELDNMGELATAKGVLDGLFVPAPSDCIWYRESAETDPSKTVIVRRRLEPVNYREELPGYRTDLDTKPYGAERTKYILRHREDAPIGKPAAGPAFWRWPDFLSWLEGPAAVTAFAEKEEEGSGSLRCIKSFGLPALDREQRTHVSIDSESQTASDGMLFVTESLRFTKREPGGSPKELGLLFTCDNPHSSDRKLRPSLVTFGGERKLSFLSETKQELPSLPPTLAEALRQKPKQGPRMARVILLTPALFNEGFAPKWIGSESVQVVAAAVQRPQIVSGWDYELVKNKEGKLVQRGPKKNRRMAPAGSVYWVELPDELDEKSTEAWLQSVWMKTLTNQMTDQDAKDGFGLCVVGVG